MKEKLRQIRELSDWLRSIAPYGDDAKGMRVSDSERSVLRLASGYMEQSANIIDRFLRQGEPLAKYDFIPVGSHVLFYPGEKFDYPFPYRFGSLCLVSKSNISDAGSSNGEEIYEIVIPGYPSGKPVKVQRSWLHPVKDEGLEKLLVRQCRNGKYVEDACASSGFKSDYLPIEQREYDNTGYFILPDKHTWYHYNLDDGTYSINPNSPVMRWKDRLPHIPMSHDSMRDFAVRELYMFVYQAVNVSSYYVEQMARSFLEEANRKRRERANSVVCTYNGHASSRPIELSFEAHFFDGLLCNPIKVVFGDKEVITDNNDIVSLSNAIAFILKGTYSVNDILSKLENKTV